MATDHNGELVTQEDYCAPMHKMGSVGLAAIENIRVKKQKKNKNPSSAATASGPAINNCRIYHDENTVKSVCKKLGYQYRATENNTAGFKETSLNKSKSVVTLDEAVKKISGAYGTNNKVKTFRTYYPCYVNSNDATTLRFVVIIRPDTDPALISEVDELYPSIPLV
jgi:hypothetical protein